MGKIHKDDDGTVFILNCKSDISTATVVKMLIKKPSGAEVEWTGALLEQGGNTFYIQFDSAAADLDEAGLYLVQASVLMPDWGGKGELNSFRVYDEWER